MLSLWVIVPVGWGRGGVGGPLKCKSCKLLGVSPCWLGVGGGAGGPFSV